MTDVTDEDELPMDGGDAASYTLPLFVAPLLSGVPMMFAALASFGVLLVYVLALLVISVIALAVADLALWKLQVRRMPTGLRAWISGGLTPFVLVIALGLSAAIESEHAVVGVAAGLASIAFVPAFLRFVTGKPPGMDPSRPRYDLDPGV